MRTNTTIDKPEPTLEQLLEIRQRRSRAVRTAWLLAVVAMLIFMMFILSGVRGG